MAGMFDFKSAESILKERQAATKKKGPRMCQRRRLFKAINTHRYHGVLNGAPKWVPIVRVPSDFNQQFLLEKSP